MRSLGATEISARASGLVRRAGEPGPGWSPHPERRPRRQVPCREGQARADTRLPGASWRARTSAPGHLLHRALPSLRREVVRDPGAALPQALEDAAGHPPAGSPVPTGQLHRREARVAEPDPKAHGHARQACYAATKGVSVRNPLVMSQPPRNSSNRPPGRRSGTATGRTPRCRSPGSASRAGTPRSSPSREVWTGSPAPASSALARILRAEGCTGAYRQDGGPVEGEGWNRGVEEGYCRVPRGLCAVPVERRCSRFGHTPAQEAPHGEVAGAWVPGAA
jgi:hypothetical protein